MVQGLPAVKWTAENNAKLLAAIATYYSGAIDLKKLAAVFGPNVPAAAISYRMSTLRKEGASMGLTSNGGPVGNTTAVKRASTARKSNGNGNKAGAKGRKRAGGMLGDDQTDDDEDLELKDESDAEQEATPPATDSANETTTTANGNKRQKTISGRITKNRVSPRKNVKKDYKALDNPFEAFHSATDGDGEKVFSTDKSESEDSATSDQDYMKGAQAATMKMEEAI